MEVHLVPRHMESLHFQTGNGLHSRQDRGHKGLSTCRTEAAAGAARHHIQNALVVCCNKSEGDFTQTVLHLAADRVAQCEPNELIVRLARRRKVQQGHMQPVRRNTRKPDFRALCEESLEVQAEIHHPRIVVMIPVEKAVIRLRDVQDPCASKGQIPQSQCPRVVADLQMRIDDQMSCRAGCRAKEVRTDAQTPAWRRAEGGNFHPLHNCWD